MSNLLSPRNCNGNSIKGLSGRRTCNARKGSETCGNRGSNTGIYGNSVQRNYLSSLPLSANRICALDPGAPSTAFGKFDNQGNCQRGSGDCYFDLVRFFIVAYLVTVGSPKIHPIERFSIFGRVLVFIAYLGELYDFNRN